MSVKRCRGGGDHWLVRHGGGWPGGAGGATENGSSVSFAACPRLGERGISVGRRRAGAAAISRCHQGTSRRGGESATGAEPAGSREGSGSARSASFRPRVSVGGCPCSLAACGSRLGGGCASDMCGCGQNQLTGSPFATCIHPRTVRAIGLRQHKHGTISPDASNSSAGRSIVIITASPQPMPESVPGRAATLGAARPTW